MLKNDSRIKYCSIFIEKRIVENTKFLEGL